MESLKERTRRNLTRVYFLSSSSVDTCYLKQHRLTRNEIPSDKIQESSLIKMRIGTIIHADIQASLGPNVEYEKPLISHKYGVQGRADIVEHNIGDPLIVSVADIKIIGGYSYKKMFGRDKEIGGIIEKYKKQVAINGVMLEEEGYFLDRMYLIVINRDDARYREVEVGEKYKDMAITYFMNVINSDENIKPLTENSPMHKWECNYCEFKTRCLANETSM